MPSNFAMLWPVMLPSQFRQALRRNGPALALWPVAERKAALRLLRLSAHARASLADALDFTAPPPPDADALRRMRVGLRRRLAARDGGAAGIDRPHMRWAALAACAIAGIAVGLGGTDQAEPSDMLAALQVAPFGQGSP